jgi:hypothetical protein
MGSTLRFLSTVCSVSSFRFLKFIGWKILADKPQQPIQTFFN